MERDLELKNEMEQELRKMIDVPYEIEEIYESGYGYVYYIKLSTRASTALDINLKLAERFKGVPIVVLWKGETDISEDELAERLADIMIAGELRPKDGKGFSAVEIVREMRENRCIEQ
jgi:hypothetical protein